MYAQISQNQWKTRFIFLFFISFICLLFYLVGQVYGDPGAYFIFGLAISVACVLGSYFYSDTLVLLTSGARPATKEEFFDYYTVTENMAIASGLPMPKLYVIDDQAPNAFATGRNTTHATICATTGLLTRLDRSEIEGVIAHELSHIKNYDILLASVVTALVGTVSIVSDVVIRGLWWRGDSDKETDKNPFLMIFFIVVLLISPLVATLIQLAISRKREYLADASGALLTRYPEGLAKALEKISAYPLQMRSASTATAHLFICSPFRAQKNMGSWFTGLFSTHPPIEDRIKILRSM